MDKRVSTKRSDEPETRVIYNAKNIYQLIPLKNNYNFLRGRARFKEKRGMDFSTKKRKIEDERGGIKKIEEYLETNYYYLHIVIC